MRRKGEDPFRDVLITRCIASTSANRSGKIGGQNRISRWRQTTPAVNGYNRRAELLAYTQRLRTNNGQMIADEGSEHDAGASNQIRSARKKKKKTFKPNMQYWRWRTKLLWIPGVSNRYSRIDGSKRKIGRLAILKNSYKRLRRALSQIRASCSCKGG